MTTTLAPPFLPPPTPESAVDESRRYATVGERVGSSLVDCTLTMVLCIPFFRAEGQSRGAAFAWLAVIWLAWYAYMYVCYRRWGQTLGKWMFRTRLVAASDHGPVTTRHILARISSFVVIALMLLPGYWVALGRAHSAGFADVGWFQRQTVIDEMTPGWGDAILGVYWLFIAACALSILVSPRKQSLHDMIGDTVVISLRAREPVVYAAPVSRGRRVLAAVDWTLTVLLGLAAGFFLVATLGARLADPSAAGAELQDAVKPMLIGAAVLGVLALLMANAALSLRSGSVGRRRGAHVLAYFCTLVPFVLLAIGFLLG